MNVTTRDYLEFARKIKTGLDRESANRAVQTRIEFESQAINQTSSVCPVYVESKFRLNISGIRDAKVKEEISRQFYNPDVMKAASCAIDAMYYGLTDRQGDVTVNQMIRKRITDLKVIASGVQGTAARLTLGSADDIAVTKFPKKQSGDNDILHELFVATVGGVNNLRSVVPNFAYIFGGFRCTPPLIDSESGQVTGWCSDLAGEHKVQFLLMENISPAESAAKYISQANANQTMSLYFQVVLALSVAYRAIEFTHYDAHTENVLMRDISATGIGRTFVIPYPRRDGTTLYVKADRVATFIDYGMAGVRYKGAYYGNHEVWRTELAIFGDKPWPLHDAYKFLMFLIMDAHEAKNDIALSVLTKIFRFFNKEEDPIALSRYTINERDTTTQWPQRFALPYIPKATKFSLDDLLDFLMTELNHKDIIFTSKPARLQALRCSNCTTFFGALKLMGSKSEVRPTTFFEFYDAATGLDVHGDQFKALKRRFPYDEASRAWLDQIEALQKTTQTAAAQTYRIDLNSFPLSKPTTLKLIRKSYFDIYHLLSLTEDLELQFKIGTWMAEHFDDHELKTYIVRSDVKSYRRILCELISHGVGIYDQIQEFMTSPEWKTRLRLNRDFQWYLTAGQILDLQAHACGGTVAPRKHQSLVVEDAVRSVPARSSSSSSSSFADYYATR